ncbi:hypothetical protein UPYG_G00034150 [Umbra pygmaea]|uniref:Uncharacterized protein n=1 Tax=Umbra pygmaea TaxID=75934 RepID=A0ABD0XNI2_UMBPY
MSPNKTILVCLLLAIYVNQVQSNNQNAGLRITTAKGGTVQPWLVGLAAVVGFLFIVFISLIVKRFFFSREKKDNYYEDIDVETKEGGNDQEVVQTNL